MNKRKSVFMILLALLLFVLGTAQGSDNSHSDSKEAVSSIITIAPDESVATTVRNNMRVEVASGQPRVLFGLNAATEGNSAESQARSFLSNNATLLHLHDVNLSDLQLQVSQASLSGSTVRMSQFVDGVAVYKGEVVVHMNQAGVVTYVTNDYRPSVAGLDVIPGVSAEAARQDALNYLNLQGELTHDTTRLVAYTHSGKARLAWEIRLIGNGTTGDFEVLVDAQSSELIKAGDISIYETGTGNVFDPDPLTTAAATYGDTGFDDNGDNDTTELNGELVNVTLQDITLSGGMYELEGPYAAIRDSESPFDGLFSQATNTFNYNRGDDAFEAVNTYYHVDSSMRYLNETIGVTVAPTQYTGGVRFDPHGLSGADNAHYSSGSGEIAFGEGGVDDAEDSGVIIHELGHGLHDWVTNGNLSQVDGLSEGSGDYWSQSYNRRLGNLAPTDAAYDFVFRWDGHNEFWNGRVTNYAAHYPEGLTGGIHADGQIWSTCNINILDIVGNTKADTAFWEGLRMTGGSTNQSDAAAAVYQAAIDLGYTPADLQVFHTEFTACGYTMPSLPGLTIDKAAAAQTAPGSSLVYTLTVNNGATTDQTNVVVTDPIPADTTYSSDTCGGSETGGVFTWNVGTLAGGGSATCMVTVSVSGALAGATIVFMDDQESGAGNWSASHTDGAIDWAQTATNPYSGVTTWFAEDVPTVTDQYLDLASAATVPSGAVLRFWHNYDTEATYDGGVVEISNDGGTSWVDAGSAMTQNGYNSTISTAYSSPIGGREAFSGDSSGYVETVVDLSAWDGDNILVRFRMATDTSANADGWFVDDVAIEISGDSITNTACAVSTETIEKCDTVVTQVVGEPTAVGLVSAETTTSTTTLLLTLLSIFTLASGGIFIARRKK